MKKVFSAALAAMLTIGGITLANPVKVEAAEDCTAFLMFTDNDWAFGNWDSTLESATTTVSGDGSYSVTLNASEVGGDGSTGANGAQVLCVDIVGAQAALAEEGKTYNVTDISVTADGTEVAVDASKLVTGDIEENGNFRIEIYNVYGDTAADSPIDAAAFTFADSVTVDFTIETVDLVAEDGAAEASTEQTAFLMFTDNDWAFGNWDATIESATTTVSGDGTYTVTLAASEVGGDGSTAANGAQVFCVDVLGLGASVTDISAITVSDVVVTADGAEVAVDESKIVTGDIEENGNFRIELFNVYGDTAADSPIDAAGFTFKDSVSVTFTLSGISYGAAAAGAEAEEAAPAAGAIDLDGKYNAYFGLQTPNWTYRDPWNAANGMGSEYWGQFIYGNETGEQYGTVTDAVIEGNGTYTVSITDFGTIMSDDFAAAGQDFFNLLYISTDIPLSDSISITDVTLKMDGNTVKTYDTAVLDPDEAEYVKILVQNIWNEDVAELPFYNAPSQSIEMSFTVSGFNYDNPNATVAEEAPATEAGTEAETADAPVEAESGSNTTIIIVVVVALAVIVAVVAVVVIKKKKTNQ